MPTQDGTGPMGQGSMTGRGAGSCGGGRAFGRGVGRGAFGCFRNFFGRGRFPTSMSPNDEKRYLQNQINAMEENLKDSKKYLSELDKRDK